jgi:hypothetical protein
LVEIEVTSGNESKLTTYYPFKTADNQYVIRADISDYLKFDSKPFSTESEIITPLQGFGLPCQTRVFNGEYNGNPIIIYQFTGTAFSGGISNHAFRVLEENGFDIFTYRLASYFENFLFTTRTNGKEIKLKETELFPFMFIHPGYAIVFKSESGNQITTEAKPAGTICALDVKEILNQLPAGTKRIAVCPDGEYAFHFIILPGKLSEERYLLRFRNSLGAFEMLEVTGRAMHAPKFSEESLYETLTEYDFYEERRSRIKTQGIIEVETGYKERREFPFILDMIKSDEIYFIYPDGSSFRCHVTADSAQYRHFMTEPTSINLKIRAVSEEEFSTPKIEFSGDFDGIFDPTFDDTSN